MHVSGNVFIYLVLLVLCEQSMTFVTEELMHELYSKYMSAVSRDNFTAATRRIFKKNRDYEIHVTKLKEVNGYKKHNLFVKESFRTGGRDSYIYINNPVESKTPKAYLTLEEFKNALIDRVMAQKNEFTSTSTTKEITYSYKNILRQHIDKNREKETTPPTTTTTTTTTTKIKTTTEQRHLKTNIDITKYSRSVNINKNRDLSKNNTTIVVPTVSAKNNNVHEKKVTNSEKVAGNNITFHLVRNINESFKHVETEKGQDNNVNTTDPTTSHSQTIHIMRSELLTDTTTVFEKPFTFQTNNSKIVTNIKNVSNESFVIKEEPRRKKTTKSSSVSIKKRRSTLGRPLVFFGSR